MQLSREDLIESYRRMKRIRAFEERIAVEFSNGNIPGFVHLYAGQEAVAVGACMNLNNDDKIGSTHRGHGHCLAKGCEVKGMMLEIYGRRDGLCKGKGGSMHIADLSKGMLGANAIVGGNPPLAVGAALAAKTLGKKEVAMAFAGDGASNQGTTFEAMNMAVVLKLPVIFMFENNGYGEFTGSSYAVGAESIAKRAAGFGMPATTVDGTDFFAVYEAVREARDRALRGEGPSAIEAVAKRYEGHFVGDPQTYRPPGEIEELKATKDPLNLFRDRVTAAELLDVATLDGVDEEVMAEVEAAVEAASKAPFPGPEDLETDVYKSYP